MGVLGRVRRRIARLRDRGGAHRSGPAPRRAPPGGADGVATPEIPATPELELARLVDVDGLLAGLVPRGRPMLVNHWATWCEGCVEELPALVRMVAELGDGLDVVGVSWEGFTVGGAGVDQLALTDEVAHEHGLTWQTLVFDGEPEELFEALALQEHQIPQTFLVGADGAVLAFHLGVVDDVFAAAVAARLAEPGPKAERALGGTESPL